MKDTSSTKVVLKFGHAETIVPLILALNLFKDGFQLKADTPIEMIQNRKWIISEIAPFSANLLIEVRELNLKKRVSFFMNEEKMSLGCDGDCTLEELEVLFSDLIGCDYDLFCRN